MTPTPSTFKEVIKLWPRKSAATADFEKAAGGKRAHVREWFHRDSIPPAWFDAVVEAAQTRGFEGITYNLLTDIYKAARASARQPNQEVI